MWSGIGLISILALCVLVLLTFDWNRAKPWLNARVSESIGRPFAINGDLSLTWYRAEAEESGWHRFIPWPRLRAQDITLGNPDWAKAAEPNMAEVRQVAFSLNPLPLLYRVIAIPTLVLQGPNLTLRRAADGSNNWTFKSNGPSKWQLELGQLELNDGRVHLVDAIKHVDVKAEIVTLDQKQADGYRIGWKLAGSFNGAAVSGNGKAGAILSLREQNEPYPIEANLRAGKTSVSVNGTLTKPRSLAAVDVQLKLSGASMAHLYPLTGILLPETPPFATEGHLFGTINREGGDWNYEKFSGKVGSSDLAGTVKYQARQPQRKGVHSRPLLTGALVSNLLQFEDLGPLIGADSNASKAKRGASAKQPPDKVLPVQEFRVERWTSIDADVKFTGHKIIRSKNLPIDNLVTDIHLKDGVLSLTPLNFGVAGGNLISDVKLDGSNKTIKAEMKISARHLKLKELFPAFQPMQASIGEVNGDAQLSATGNSIATLLGSANGEIKALVNQGTVSKLLLDEIGLNVGSIILTKLFGDRQVNINCMVSDFGVTNGLMEARTFVIDTDDAILLISGQIDLAKEQLNLTINPRSKGLRLVSLRSPIHLAGSFKKPDVNVDKATLVAKAGSAIALGALTLPAALLPLINAGDAKDSGCNRLLEEAKIKPVAPPPGKTYQGKSAVGEPAR
jgi:uncharacterized protein involved in outer membrane biogenesis